MALAILSWQETNDESNVFDIDIGITNRYYRYEIGNKSTRRSNGLKRLATSAVRSSLLGPLPKESLGRKSLVIPNAQLDRTNRYVQLTSFRTAQCDGPALSVIVEVPVAGLQRERDRTTTLALSLENEMHTRTDTDEHVETIAFAIKEAAPIDMEMAIAMAPSWLRKVGNIAKKATAVINNPQAQNALKQAGNFLANPQKQQMLMNAGTSLLSGLGQTNQQTLNTEAIEQLLNHLVQKSESVEQLLNTLIQRGGVGGAGLMPLQQPMLATGLVPTPGLPRQQVGRRLPVNTTNLANRQMQQVQLKQAQLQQRQPVTLRRNKTPTISRARSLSLAASMPTAGATSQPMALPALAALPSLLGSAGSLFGGAGGASGLMGAAAGGAGNLPALMPLLQQVLTPETVQMLLQTMSPSKLLGAITDGLTQIFKVNLEYTKQNQDHLEKLMANSGDAAMEQWAYGQAVIDTLTGSSQALDFRRVGRVRLEFDAVIPVMLHGRSRVLYHQDRDIAFPITVETPRSIAKGIVQLLVKDPETLDILIEKKYRVEDVDTGSLEVTPQLTRDDLEILKPNEDYLVMVALIWQGRSKREPRTRRIGTSMTQMMTLMRDYCFDRIEGQEETVALREVDRYRAFWHQVWQGQLSSRRRRVTLDCKYYYSFDRDRTDLARMETLTRIQRVSETSHEGQMKTGLVLNPERLNELLGQISDHPPLDEEQLAALLNSDNMNLFNALARTKVNFKGARGTIVALWVYPEFKISRIILKQASKINDNGQVTELEEYPVYFPMPAKAHFIGVSDDD